MVTTPAEVSLNIQRLFGSQRALKTVEDFTEFEQRAAYFDGDPVIATKKGVNILERGSQVHFMAEFQEILDFPPAPKLDVYGKLDPKKATPAELRGQGVFFGKGTCASCHVPPYYTDNLMHNLQAERFFKPVMISSRRSSQPSGTAPQDVARRSRSPRRRSVETSKNSLPHSRHRYALRTAVLSARTRPRGRISARRHCGQMRSRASLGEGLELSTSSLRSLLFSLIEGIGGVSVGG